MGTTVAALVAPLAPGDALSGTYSLASIDEDTATITLRAGDERLVVQLRPRDPARPCYEATRSLNVSYVGSAGGGLATDASRALRALLDVLSRNDRGEPLANLRRELPIAPMPAGHGQERVENGLGYVRVDSTCEMSCIFCTRGEGGHLPKPRPLSPRIDVEREIDRLVSEGAHTIVFGGDEPLTHPDVEALIGRARRGSVREVHLVTSGQRLHDRAMVERLARAGVTKVELPIYGPSADVHDAITKLPGSFDQIVRAVRTLKDAGLAVGVHTILMRQNLEHVAALRRFVREDLGLRDISFAHLMPRSDSLADYRAKMPSYAEVRRALAGSGVSLLFFPSCVAEVVGSVARASSSEAGAASQRVKPRSRCGTCSARERCPGTFDRHVRAFGELELEAFA